MTVNLDGMLKLHSAYCQEAHCQADIAKKMAGTGVIWQQAEEARLRNVALFLNIQWDDQAHTNLLKQRNIALQEAQRLEKKQKILESKIQAMGKLLTGGTGSLEAIQQGWIGFFYVRGAVPPSTIIQAYRSVKPDADVFNLNSWTHPWAAKGSVVAGIPRDKDLTVLFQWAARGNYYPKQGWGAWEYLAQLIETIDKACNTAAAEVAAKTEKAKLAALELSKLDWKRLETPAGVKKGTES